MLRDAVAAYGPSLHFHVNLKHVRGQLDPAQTEQRVGAERGELVARAARALRSANSALMPKTMDLQNTEYRIHLFYRDTM